MSADPSEISESQPPAAMPARNVLAPQMSRLAAFWRLLILAGALTVYERAAPVIGRWWFAPGQAADEFHWAAFHMTLLFALAVLLTITLVPVRDLRRLGITSDNIVAQLSWAIFAVASTYALEVMLVVPYWLWFRPAPSEGNPVARTLFEAALTEDYAGAVVLLIMIGAAAEELLFRGLMLRYLDRLFHSAWLAILISAVVFGLGHLSSSNFNAVMAFVMGLVLGTVYVLRGSLLTVIVAHFLYNFTNLLLVRALWPAG